MSAQMRSARAGWLCLPPTSLFFSLPFSVATLLKAAIYLCRPFLWSKAFYNATSADNMTDDKSIEVINAKVKNNHTCCSELCSQLPIQEEGAVRGRHQDLAADTHSTAGDSTKTCVSIGSWTDVLGHSATDTVPECLTPLQDKRWTSLTCCARLVSTWQPLPWPWAWTKRRWVPWITTPFCSCSPSTPRSQSDCQALHGQPQDTMTETLATWANQSRD